MSFYIVSRNRYGFFRVSKAPCHFAEVSRQMLRTDLVQCSHDAAPQEREGRFHTVRMKVSAHVFSRAVVDGLTLVCWGSSFLHSERIGDQIICHYDAHSPADVFLDVCFN